MAKPKVVPTAARRPGRCAISKETQGPFLDTGKDIPRFGRVYLSFRWLEPMLRNNEHLNFIPETEVEELREQVREAKEREAAAEERAEDFDALIEAVTPYLPESETEVQEVEVVRHRKPTDEEIQHWIQQNGGDHPAVRRARRPEPGSTEEWYALYGGKAPTQPAPTVSPPPSTEVSEEEPTEEAGPSKTFEVHGQDVDLDEVLSLNVKDIGNFAADKSEEFQAALVRREFHLAQQNEGRVRKGVLDPLGYWDDEEDEPLIPLDETDETENDEDSDNEEE